MADPMAIVDDPGGTGQDSSASPTSDDGTRHQETSPTKIYALRAEIPSKLSRRASGRSNPIARQLFRELLKIPDTTITSKGKKAQFLQNYDDVKAIGADLSSIFCDPESIETPSGAIKMIFHFQVESSLSLTDLKQEMLQYLKRTRIHLTEDYCGKGRQTATGFFLYMHPKAENLSALREEIACKTGISQVEVRLSTHGSRIQGQSNKYITTRAVTVFCRHANFHKMQQQLSEIELSGYRPHCTFVPMGKALPPEKLAELINQQNGFLRETRTRRVATPEGDSRSLITQFRDDSTGRPICLGVIDKGDEVSTIIYRQSDWNAIDQVIRTLSPTHHGLESSTTLGSIEDRSALVASMNEVPTLFPTTIHFPTRTPRSAKKAPAWNLDTNSVSFPRLSSQKKKKKKKHTSSQEYGTDNSKRTYASVASLSTPPRKGSSHGSNEEEWPSDSSLSTLTTPKTRGSGRTEPSWPNTTGGRGGGGRGLGDTRGRGGRAHPTRPVPPRTNELETKITRLERQMSTLMTQMAMLAEIAGPLLQAAREATEATTPDDEEDSPSKSIPTNLFQTTTELIEPASILTPIKETHTAPGNSKRSAPSPATEEPSPHAQAHEPKLRRRNTWSYPTTGSLISTFDNAPPTATATSSHCKDGASENKPKEQGALKAHKQL